MATSSHPDVIALAWCENVWCGSVYELDEGWGGRCPSCLALEDEHLAGMHVVLIEACVECRRDSAAATSGVALRPARRAR